MGEEYGETNPFLYFVSHGDADLIQAVREGRRWEFAAFGWAGDIPDPQSESTFAGSSLDWGRSEEGNHARLRALYTDLLRMRHQEPALRPGSASISVKHSESDQWVSLTLQATGSSLIASFNFGSVERILALESPGGHAAVLSTDDPRYGGEGKSGLTSTGLRLAPRSAALLRLL
jgi:maltooligosyltrehalose trehalohydrolase